MRQWVASTWLAAAWLAQLPQARGEPVALQRLLASYPDHLSHIAGNDLVWRDGTRMTIDDGGPPKSFEQRLARPDLKDMFHAAYAAGRSGLPPAPFIDSGRVRHAAFFNKMYGDCATGATARHLVEIVWLPRTAPQKLKVTRINGVSERLEAISRDLEALPAPMRKFLSPSAGTYVCRPIAGTDRGSSHGFGIAIDIAVAGSDYWQWSQRSAHSPIAWKNRVPLEIVEVFERHGFIWGGKWYHFDTMHFEYRPELLPPKP